MLSADAIINLISQHLGQPVQTLASRSSAVSVQIPVDQWAATANFLRKDDRLRFDWLRCLTGVDYAADGMLGVYYHLWSFELRHELEVKVAVSRALPTIPSVADLWRTADWHEREAFDLLGINFAGHPDLRRILMSDDWEGYPLRKDYVFPREYHGIPASVELDWQQH